jgi:hypothetical protein
MCQTVERLLARLSRLIVVCRFSKLTVSSSNGNTATLTDAATIRTIADAMRDGIAYQSAFT